MRPSHEEAPTLAAPLTQPILQFGTSRFLQAHVDLFVSEALESGQPGAAPGGIAVVQTTESADSAARVAALANGRGYPVHIRGLHSGRLIDVTLTGRAIRQAVHVRRDWARIRQTICGPVQIVVSNTGDQGYQLDERDNASDFADPSRVPHSFPARLLSLLHTRWQNHPEAPLSLFPCELIEKNGEVLRGIAVELALRWQMPEEFIRYLIDHCVWANSLVDRIVSEPIRPVGAIAEPYALWAIEQQPRLQIPCVHPSIVLTQNLQHFERRKLFLLNLGHTFLAERWLREARATDETVCAAMNDPVLRAELETVWQQEVLPVFDLLGEGDDALAYVAQVRERLLNPFLAHRLADIAQNHAQKKQRRIAPLLALAASLMRATGTIVDQPLLTEMMAGDI
ncbi:tagaturonate reductase [Burkholderia sp. WP9]|uniref:mannitol dehydrogenase family protein n=1 Tax=Burkholderia sp. WP9 TaxID=1500263 RepID=UPI0008982D38|nr:D-mannonate oxidoreductase [Burkholderia sp. WP9]SEE92864.1 tagaturonate reductase [Burkholderia sp. WP9]